MKSYTEHKSWQNFAYNVKWLRLHYEFSKERMAEILGISVDMLEKIEKNEIPENLSVEDILNISKFFLIESRELLEIRLENKK